MSLHPGPASFRLTGFGALALAGLLAASCTSSETGGYETADRILARVDQQEVQPLAGEFDEEVLGPSCVLEVREDEYGMTFEVCVPSAETVTPEGAGSPESEETAIAEEPATSEETVIDDADQAVADEQLDNAPQAEQPLAPVSAPASVAETQLLSPERFDELVALVPPSPAATTLSELAAALTAMDQACAVSPAAWAASLPDVAEDMTTAAPLTRQLPDFRESPEARELARSLVERVALQSGCSSPASSEAPVGGIGVDDLVAANATTTAAIEPLYQALWGDGKSPFFYHPDELAQRRWMREEGSIDLVLAGTSQTLLGVEPDLIAEQLGLSVGSVAIPGAVAEVQQHWLPEVQMAVSPRIVLWGIGPLDLVSACKPDGRAEEFDRLATLKRDVLFPFSWANGVPQLDRLIGPPGTSFHDDTPTAVTMATRFPNPLGDAFEFAQADPNEMAASLERFRRAFERGDFCADRQALIGHVIEGLEAAGTKVIVFGMPLSPELAATYAGGNPALHALVDNAAVTVFEPAGAEYLGMMTSIDDPSGAFWFDVVHPTRAGGATLSTELGSALEAAGVS